MTTELFIEDQKADISTDLASLLTLAIDDIKDFSSRQTSFSKTISLPGSANNNKILGSIFEIAVRNDYDSGSPNVGINFNASASANCVIFQDFLQTFKGTLRILQINIDRGKIEYEAAVAGNLSQLNVRLSSGLLEDLDFSAHDTNYTVSAIVSSWDNTPGSGVYFPLIDYGTFSTDKHSWQYKTFRPALYVKEYIDKMFTAASFRYSSALLNTDRFKRLVVPHNQSTFQRPERYTLNVFANTPFHYTNGEGSSFSISFPNQPILQNFTVTGGNSVFTYTGGTRFSGTAQLNVSGTFNKTDSATPFIISLYLNGTPIAQQSSGAGTTSGSASANLAVPVNLNNGDFLQGFISFAGGGTWDLQVFGANMNVQSVTDTYVDILLGDPVPVNGTIPRNVRQIDFLVSIVKLFNLYVYEDKFDENLIYITPYVDFYSPDSASAVDWTYKLDRANPTTIKPMSEINAKVYNFTYKEDSDYYNDLYKKRYNQVYGAHIFDTTFEFVSQTQNIELIFASTPLLGYASEDKVYPTIFKLSGTTEQTCDSVIRIMQTKKVTGVNSWNILDGSTVLASETTYGYAGHFNDPDNVANDLNFGALQELFFILVSGDLTVTQFNVYWSPYMAEVTDKDSKLLTGKFYLTPQDILNLDFSKYVNVDGNLFRLNKITDYNMTKPDLCEIELLKVINTTY